jgi:hypothetical protein
MALPPGFVLEEPRVNLPAGFVLEQTPPPPEKQSAFRQVADIPLGIAKGAVQGVRMIADAFGAGSDTSKTIKSAETYLADLMSAQAKNDQQEISRIMKDAEDKGVLDQVKAAVKAFSVAPVDTLSSALGTAAPVIVGALGAKVLGAGALVSTGVSALTGAGMGAGVVKGSIYEETKDTLKKAGASEEEAERRAQLAQEYNGKNLDQILLGTVLGGAAAVGPLEKGAAGILARRILGKTGVEATESVSEQAAKGALRRRAEAGVLEAVPEAVQAGQEQVAQNIALQREGFDVPTFRGAVGAATLEAIAGGGLGATLGGGKPEVAAPRTGPLTPEEQAELDRQRTAAERPKTTEELLAETDIQTGRPTTSEDIARIRDEHETAVIEGLLAQDAEMKKANDWIAAEMERVNKLDELRDQARNEEERQAIEQQILTTGIRDVDQRVREGRIMSRVQDLIDRNIPYASTAINDINQKFGVINEAPLTEGERARVENIMGMVNTFTNFVNLPVLAPKPVDQFAENQAMEALIKERTERGQAEPLRAAPAAPSPRIEEAPVSQGVGESPAVRPAGGVEPSAAEDRKLVTTPAAQPAAAAPSPAAPTAVEAPASPDRAAVQNTLNTLNDGDTIVTDDGDRIPVTRVLRNKAGDVTAIVTTKIGEEGYANIDFDGLASFVTPQPYIDSTTGERKFSAPATIEKPKAAAPAAVETTTPAAEKVTPKTGDFVKLTVPGVDGPVGRAGKVEQILPSGDVEVRTQQGEIVSKPAGEVTVVTPAAPKAEAPAAEEPAVDVAQQVKDLREQQTKLLTKSGKVPAPRSPARQKYDVLERQIAELENRQLEVKTRKPRKRPSTIMGSPMLAGIFNKIGGLHPSLLSEFSTKFFTKKLDKKGRPITAVRNPMVTGYGTLFNKDGKFDYSEIAEHLEAEGYLELGSVERDYKDAGERAKELIKKALNNEEVLPIQEQIDRDNQEREASERQRTLDRQEENRMIASGELQLEPEFDWTNKQFEENLGLDREFETDLEMYNLEPKDLEFLSDEELESELTDAEREQAQARRTRKAEEDAARQKAEGAAPREDEALLTRPTAEGLKAKQEAAEKAAAAEKKAKAAEQERLRKEQQAKEEKARADETVKDFELGKSAEEQMTGMGDLFAEPPAPAAPSVGGFRRATAREADSDNAQFVYDVGNGARLLFVPSQNGDVYVAAPGKGASLVVRTGDNRDNVIKTVDQFPDYIPENIRQIVLDYHKAVQGKTTDEEQTAVAMEMAEKIETLTSPKKKAPPKREPRQGTPKQLETADKIAKEFGATVVYQDGDLALMRGFSKLDGQPTYMAINGVYYFRRDISSSTFPKDLVTPEQRSALIKIKEELEAEDKAKFDKQPSIKFTDGLATSANVSPEIAGIVRGWKDLLGLKVNIYITTIDDAVADRNKFTGPHRAIGSAGLDSREAGVVRKLPNGDYYIAFKKSTNKTKMLEVIAHELGHIHESEVFNRADKETRQQILDEHSKWLKKQTGKTAREFVTALRAKTAGRTTRIGEGMMASEMDAGYWKAFTEWYADQISRWAVTSEKPVSVVEKFFSRLAQALKSFYSKLKNAGYLPNETFVQYLNKTHAPSDHVISTDDGAAQQMLGEVKAAAPTGAPGQQALQTIRSMGMDVPKPDPTKLEKAKDIWTKAKEDPKLTAQSAAKVARDFLDKVETWSFSSDAKLNNDYRRAIISDIKQNEGVIGQLLEMSQSQAVHADALASQFMIEGGLKYNDELKKWESFDAKANFPELSKKLDEIGKKYNLSKEQIERVAHTYLVSKRLPGLIERNRQLDEEIAAEQATSKPDKKKIQDLEDKKVFISDKQLEQMEPGLSLGKTIPELSQVVNMWNEIRKNTIDVMVNSGLWSPEYAQAMWDNMDYVPYFREDQIENEKGPQEFIRGLQVKSKEFQLKGSEDAVHDVFDNMIRWTQYAINRSVRAHKALQMIDNSKDIKVGDRKMAEKVTEEKRGMNIVRVFRDGKQELYDMADPLYVQAFAGIQNVSIPTLKFMSKISDILRNSVVLYPLFSVAQVPQDSFAAMFTSGLKTQHALKIPYLAVKEFVKTLARTSQTHEVLKKFGATGVRDFSATVIRDDAEIYAGLKPPRGGWGKTKEFLSHISMAADNAVRQAVYEASIQQGVSRSEAIEKAFEVINFRRKGTSKMLNILGQTVPFFYAYLSAQRVAYKVLTGVGISPTDRAEAGKTLAMTSAAVATLSMLYAMANGDDEDYMETPANIRDRTLTIPGSGGVRIPLRPDFFLFPKIIAEHTYLLLAEKGYQDAAKFKTSMKDALFSAIASPTPFPTAIKPAIEVAINYDFFQGKPLIGNFEKQKDLERQFRDSTSEFAKLLGATGMISPIAADHMIRGMFGSFGGLFLFGTNQFLHSDPDVPRPEMNATEMLAALPGTSGLLKRPQESALKNDFYTLRDEVEKAVNTFNDIKTRSPEGIEAFLADEKQMARLMLGKPVDKINRELSKIRRQITIITNMPENQMSAADKADYKRQLMELEREVLRSVNVKELREMAKI